MIGKLTGSFGGDTGDGSILIEVGGVGYCVRMPLGDLADAGLRDGSPISLFIHTVVREDALDLYGFRTRDELSFFRMLMSVSGIGPKTAIGILSVADVSSLRKAIAGGDATVLTKIYGVGKKSAERIVVELKDKLARDTDARGESGALPIDAEVLEALEALGYSAAESRKALQHISKDLPDVRGRLAAALKHLGTPSNA